MEWVQRHPRDLRVLACQLLNQPGFSPEQTDLLFQVRRSIIKYERPALEDLSETPHSVLLYEPMRISHPAAYQWALAQATICRLTSRKADPRPETDVTMNNHSRTWIWFCDFAALDAKRNGKLPTLEPSLKCGEPQIRTTSTLSG
ncbi:hypothetical protein TURU_084517 [Turdus rufiventris]|nr:hypothetical protein TURU_084517 [Turdus rufiventris]